MELLPRASGKRTPVTVVRPSAPQTPRTGSGAGPAKGGYPTPPGKLLSVEELAVPRTSKKQSKGESHPKIVHASETTTECVSLEQRWRLIEKQLCTIHPNPGPRRGRHGGRNMEWRMERRKRRRDRRQNRNKEEKIQQLRIVMWNLQGITTNENNRGRLRSVARGSDMAGRERGSDGHNPLKTSRNNTPGKESAEMDRGVREEEMHRENSGGEDRGGKFHLSIPTKLGARS